MFYRITFSLLEGFGQNLIIFFVSLSLSLPLGLAIAFGEMSKNKIISWFFKFLVWLIRGTPLMLQLFIVFYVPGLLFDAPFRSRMIATLIAFVINYAAYFAEIYRGAIMGISKGQYEAGQVLGLSKSQTFWNIILFQVVGRMLAPIENEVFTLIKDTSLARVIAVPEMLLVATEFTSQGLVWPLFYTGVFYLVATLIITWVFRGLERRFEYAKS